MRTALLENKGRYCSPRMVSCKDGYTYYEMEYFLHHQNAQSHTHILSLEYTGNRSSLCHKLFGMAACNRTPSERKKNHGAKLPQPAHHLKHFSVAWDIQNVFTITSKTSL